MRAPRSVHTYLVGLIVGVLLPLLGFSGFVVIRAAEHEQAATAMLARNRTRLATAAIEEELGALRSRLFLLAGTLSLQTSDLNEFHARAKEAFDPMTVVLSDASGEEIVNTSQPYGQPLPTNPDLDTLRYVARTRLPRVAGLSRDPITGRPAVTISVPVMRDSQLVYILSLDISSTLPRILAALDLPEGWIAAIFDRNGYMIGRSRDPDRYIGQKAFPAFLSYMRSENEGMVPGMSREGTPMFSAFAHSKLGDWTVNAGMPRDVLLGPVRQTTFLLILLGGGTVAVAVTLAVLIARRIATPVVGLVPIAEAVGRGELVSPRRTGLIEADTVALALCGAGERLRQAATEQASVNSALSQSEQKFRTLAEDLARIDEERTALVNGVVVAQEDERKRIARELHDSLAQYLTALRLKLDTLCEAGPSRPMVLEELRSLIARLGEAVNRLAWELRPVALDELGLEQAVSHYLEEWGELAQLPVDLEVKLDGKALPPAVETTLLRVLQEATTNVLRHAEATRVGVLLEARGDQIRLIVEDDGKGFPAAAGKSPFTASRRFGLFGMRERLALVHGTLDVESSPDNGTTLFVRIPLGHALRETGREAP